MLKVERRPHAVPVAAVGREQRGDDLLGQFFLSEWHEMHSFGCDTTRFSLWKWCRLKEADQLQGLPERTPDRGLWMVGEQTQLWALGART